MLALASPRSRPLLIGGIAVPAALVGSLLSVTGASAVGSTETTKAGLVAAFQAATNGSVITLGADLLGDGGANDVLTVPNNRSFRFDLNGHSIDLDAMQLGAASSLVVLNGLGSGGALSVGAASIAPNDGQAGIRLSSRALLEVQGGVQLASSASTGLAGIGTAAGDDAAARLYIDDGARVTATGGAHGAGIGGGEGATPLSTVSIGHATVVATGGDGAAAIGGGFGSTGAAPAVSIENGDVTLSGGIASTFSSLDNLATGGGTSTLRVAADSTLTVPAGRTLRSTGDLEVLGELTGSGTIDNPGGTIRRGPTGTIDDGALTVTGRNHAVTFAPGAGSTTAPAVQHVYATTFAAAGLDLGSYTGSASGTPLVGWTAPGATHVTNDDALAALASTGGESDPVTLTAAYEAPIAFSATSLPNAATGQRYERQAPVTGGATTFAVATNLASGLPADTIPAFPVGMAIDAATGVITGTPTTSGHYSFVLTASSPHQRRSQVVSLDVAGAPVIATTELPGATAGSPYGVPILATSERGPITWSITAGAPPAGLGLDPASGLLTGTPTAAGSSAFTVAATNPFGTVVLTFTIEVAPAPDPSTGGSSTDGSGGTAGSSGDGSSSGAPSDPGAGGAPTAPAVRPVLPVLGTTTVRLGHPLVMSVAASSAAPTTYSVPAKDLPAGISLDRASGLLFGAPRTSGRFVLHVTAANTAGAASRAYVLVVPAVTHLVTGSASAITPRSGTSVQVTVHGLRAGERWRIALNGRQTATGVSRFGGSAQRTVRLPARPKDTVHRIRVSGDRRVTDPATTAAHELTVTAVAPRKTLRLTRSGGMLTVRGLAAHERVTITRGTSVVATGRADVHGVFVVRRSHLKPGTHAATGSTRQRTGRVAVR